MRQQLRRIALYLSFLAGVGALAFTQVEKTGTLVVRILDPQGRPTPARVNVIGSDHAYYEPDAARNPLSPFSLKRKGNRSDRGPARYYGSFFYTNGSFEVTLPPGPARLEVRKGYSNYPAIFDAAVVAHRSTPIDIPLAPLVDMAKEGWHSVDTHLHFERPLGDDPRLFDLLEAEDVRFGHSLSGNSTSRYTGDPADQGTVQSLGYGPGSEARRGSSAIVSGNEFISPALGHVTQILIDGLPQADGKSTDTAKGPALATIYDQTVERSGAMGHAHGGSSQEIYADVVLRKSDWVELLQFGGYRGIRLEGYYLTLNAGFRYPLNGASDYPFCRTLSDSISYVMDGPGATFESLAGGLLRAESFATSGPLLFLTVDGKGPGGQIDVLGSAPLKLRVEVRAFSASLPFQELELVVNGKVAASFPSPGPVLSREGSAEIEISQSSWIAARCHGAHDTYAHTNPVWVLFDGRVPFLPEAAEALRTRIAGFKPAGVRADVLAVLDRAKTQIDRTAAQGPRPVAPLNNYPRSSAIRPGAAPSTLLPRPNPRPAPPAPATIAGTVVTETGAPLAGARVSARGEEPSTQTDASGRFTLAAVVTEAPLFLRVSKPGHRTTNTSYLNPQSASKLRILCPSTSAAQALFSAWASHERTLEPGFFDTRPLLFIQVDKSDIRVGASPAGRGRMDSAFGTRLAYADAGGTFTGSATLAAAPSGIQLIGSTQIHFPDSADEDDSREPNVILSFSPLGKDMVAPVFAGQLTIVNAVAEPGRD
jgi:hypothetical protein